MVQIGQMVEGVPLEITRAHGSHHHADHSDSEGQERREGHGRRVGDRREDEHGTKGIDSCCGEKLVEPKPNE